MFFIWKRAAEGDLWISDDTLKSVIQKRLPGIPEILDVSIDGDDSTLNVTLAIPEETEKPEVNEWANRLERLFSPLGFSKVNARWAQRTAPAEGALWKKKLADPVSWALIAATVAAAFLLGIEGILLVVFVSAVGFGVAWFLFRLGGLERITEWFRRLANKTKK
ncbi:MAG: hypothetical protein U9R40_06335 [Synergistota bacterium]|nr:hypothetical protein [Synergistota bacterium]